MARFENTVGVSKSAVLNVGFAAAFLGLADFTSDADWNLGLVGDVGEYGARPRWPSVYVWIGSGGGDRVDCFGVCEEEEEPWCAGAGFLGA